MRTPIALCALLLACATAAQKKTATLPPAEEQAFWACEPYLWNHCLQLSLAQGDTPFREACASTAADQYLALQGAAERQAYLEARGCPSMRARVSPAEPAQGAEPVPASGTLPPGR
jgi:hypothetical protein